MKPLVEKAHCEQEKRSTKKNGKMSSTDVLCASLPNGTTISIHAELIRVELPTGFALREFDGPDLRTAVHVALLYIASGQHPLSSPSKQ